MLFDKTNKDIALISMSTNDDQNSIVELINQMNGEIRKHKITIDKLEKQILSS